MESTWNSGRLSLIDLKPGYEALDWYVVYFTRPPHFFWQRWVKQGFRHCELWRAYRFGPGLGQVLWLVLRPNFEVLRSHLEFDPKPPWEIPGATVQKVYVVFKLWKTRQWLHFGPWTCTEAVKAGLGINKFWLRTPHQLYQYIKHHHGVLRAK